MTKPLELASCNGERVLMRRRVKSCETCGAEFEAMRPHQRFCRPSCRKAAFEERQRDLPLRYYGA